MKSRIWLLFFLCLSTARADELDKLINAGKWANAKWLLIQNKPNYSPEAYYGHHINLCYFLNELEIGKAYSDSISGCKQFNQSPLAQSQYHWFMARYNQYHQLNSASLYHAKLSIVFAESSNSAPTLAFAYAQLANTLRGFERIDGTLYAQRTAFAKKAVQLAASFGGDWLFYRAKIVQLTGLIWYEEAGRKILSPKETLKSITESSEIIRKRFPKHPQLIHNYIISAHAWLDENPDSALAYCEQAEKLLTEVNDFSHGILISLSSALFNQMELAYEAKFNQTQNTDYLNRAIVWAKHNMWLLNHRLHYEGFYFYRRYDDKTSKPIEQRIANLYYKLYLKTKNTNYLNFTLKYAEYLHHRPIQQIGVTIPLYESLPQLVAIENGTFKASSDEIQQTDKLITHPKYISGLLKPNEAFLAYFSYQETNSDSVTFLVQLITAKRQQFLSMRYASEQLDRLPENLVEATLTNDEDNYAYYAKRGYQIMLEPVLAKLDKQVNKLVIIPPANFSVPLAFEGLILPNGGKDYASFRYVFDKYNVSYEQSFTHFASNQKSKVNVSNINFWSPDYSQTPYADLSESPVLQQRIKTYFSTEQVRYDSKRELALQLLKAPILHVSAHANGAFTNLERPRIYTALTNEDSLFFDIDLEQLSGNTLLAVFAACKSSNGHVQNNGVIDGFTRALLSSGGGGTITSLYTIEESITTKTLTYFYEYLGSGLPVDEALYLAKQKIKKEHPNPKQWQAFIYTGSRLTFLQENSQKEAVQLMLSLLVFVGFIIALINSKL